MVLRNQAVARKSQALRNAEANADHVSEVVKNEAASDAANVEVADVIRKNVLMVAKRLEEEDVRKRQVPSVNQDALKEARTSVSQDVEREVDAASAARKVRRANVDQDVEREVAERRNARINVKRQEEKDARKSPDPNASQVVPREARTSVNHADDLVVDLGVKSFFF